MRREYCVHAAYMGQCLGDILAVPEIRSGTLQSSMLGELRAKPSGSSSR